MNRRTAPVGQPRVHPVRAAPNARRPVDPHRSAGRRRSRPPGVAAGRIRGFLLAGLSRPVESHETDRRGAAAACAPTQPSSRSPAAARSAAAARTGRADLHEDTPALAVNGGGVVTPAGRVRCDAVVVAVDGGLDLLLPELVGRVRTTRLQMLATAPTHDVVVPCPVYSRWGHDYWQQLADGRIALGGGRDLGGDAEWTHRAETSDVVQRGLDRLLRERLGVAAPVTHRWAATVGYTANRMPVADEMRPGVWAVGAYSGTGNVLGALLGRGVAQAALHGSSPLLAAFS